MEPEYYVRFSVKQKGNVDVTREFTDSLYCFIAQMEGPADFFEYDLLKETSENGRQMNVIVTKSKELADVLPDSIRETKKMYFKGRNLRMRILPTTTLERML